VAVVGPFSSYPQNRPLWPRECGSPPLVIHLRGVLPDAIIVQKCDFVKLPHWSTGIPLQYVPTRARHVPGLTSSVCVDVAAGTKSLKDEMSSLSGFPLSSLQANRTAVTRSPSRSNTPSSSVATQRLSLPPTLVRLAFVFHNHGSRSALISLGNPSGVSRYCGHCRLCICRSFTCLGVHVEGWFERERLVGLELRLLGQRYVSTVDA